MIWWCLQQLKSRKPEARAAAIGKLALSRSLEILDPIAGASSDPEVIVRKAVATALGFFQDDRIVIPLTALLNDLSPEVREAAARGLGEAKLQCAERALISALKDPNSDVRLAAAKALDRMGWQPQCSEERAMHSIATGKFMQAAQEGETAFVPLVAALKGDTYSQRKAAIEALSRIEDARALRPLLHSLKDPDSHVRVSAVEALGRLGNPEAIDALVQAMKDEFSPVRAAAADVLGRMGGPKALVPLTVGLRDKSWEVRRASVESLGRLGDLRAIEPMVALLKDKDPDVRLTTVRTLGVLKSPEGIAPLVTALADEQRTVRETAAGVLIKIDPKWETTDEAQKAIPDLEAAHRSREYWVRLAADEALKRIAAARTTSGNLEPGGPVVASETTEIIRLMLELLRDPDRDFRLAAAEALGRTGDTRVALALGPSLQDIDPWVSQAAQAACDEIQQRSAQK
ncbi:MAG: HEAT repeat domain-containing protein [Verrucomicrobia bacterium]|nr:HEAT repeat domain-containing protein [Verrucomicrobiota bacterium]